MVFLLFGLAAWLRPPGDERLPLNAHLWLLAGFGLTQGLSALPASLGLLPPRPLIASDLVTALSLLLSYLFLLEFSRRLLASLQLPELPPPLLYLPVALALTIATLALPLPLAPALEASARYLIALPAGLLTAYGILRFLRLEREALQELRLRPYFLLGALGATGFGLSEGLVINHHGSVAALLFTQRDFEHATGLSLPGLRLLFATISTFSLLVVVRRLNYDSFLRERSYRQALETLNTVLEQRIKERTTAVAESNSALQRSQDMLQRAQAVARLGSWELDPVTEWMEWSDELFRILEVPTAGFQHRLNELLERLAASDRGSLNHLLASCRESQRPFSLVCQLMMPDGRVKYAQIRGDYRPPQDGVATLIGTVQDMTSLHQAETELRAAEERYQNLIGNLPGAVYRYLMDDDCTCHTFSDNIEALTGYPASHFVDQPAQRYMDLIHPDDRDRVWQTAMAAVEAHGPILLDYRLITAQGDTRWLHERGHTTYADTDTPLHIDGIVIDVTEQRAAERADRTQEEQRLRALVQEQSERLQAEQALDQSRHELKTLIEPMPVAMLVTESDGDRIRLVNARFVELFGAPEDDTLDRWWQRQSLDADAEPAPTTALRDGQIVDCTLLGRDQLPRSLQAHLTPAGNERVLLLIDFTAQRQGDEQRRQLQFALNHIGEQTLLIDAAARIRNANQAAAEQLGYTLPDMLGLSLYDIEPQLSVTHWAALWVQLTRERRLSLETRHRRRDRSDYPVAINAYYFDYLGEPFVFAVCNDITTRKQVELQLHLRTTVLELMNRGAPLDLILGHIADGVEHLFPGSRCALLLVTEDGQHLRFAAAPRLPDAFRSTLDGLLVAEGVAGAGTAVARRRAVTLEDVQHHPYWSSYRGVLAAADIQASHAEPIVAGSGHILGALELYYSQPFIQVDHETLEALIVLARLAIERAQADAHMRLAAAVYEHAAEGILVTDAATHILSVNRAFCEITGYSAAEVLGKTPRILSSGRHDAPFYQAMWQQLNNEGLWQGEIWNRRHNGEDYPEWLRITALRDKSGQLTHYLAVFADITERKRAEEQIAWLAYHDPLTHLPNRSLLLDRLGQALHQAERHNQQVAVLFIDLDRFKAINDSLGHHVGDRVLQTVAARLGDCVRSTDTVARLGGDEFVVVLTELEDPDGATRVAAAIFEALEQRLEVADQLLYVTPSIGISLYPSDGQESDVLLQAADSAMYHAKQAGRSTYRFYADDMNTMARARFALERNLRGAIEREELELHFQPLVDASGRILAAEALLRWNTADGVRYYPNDFMAVAEDSGLILAMGDWVLLEACRHCQRWRQQGHEGLRIAVNLSPRQFHQRDVAALVEATLKATGLPAEALELEITEGLLMEHSNGLIDMLAALRALGTTVAIDDFGTGYSSLSYLKRFPINKLKIDRSFVHDLPDDPDSTAIVQAVIALARAMALTVIAEGVETEAQRSQLLALGCHELQGFLFSPPVPAAAFLELLQAPLPGA